MTRYRTHRHGVLAFATVALSGCVCEDGVWMDGSWMASTEVNYVSDHPDPPPNCDIVRMTRFSKSSAAIADRVLAHVGHRGDIAGKNHLVALHQHRAFHQLSVGADKGDIGQIQVLAENRREETMAADAQPLAAAPGMIAPAMAVDQKLFTLDADLALDPAERLGMVR